MLFENFSVGRHNSHYEGGYSESELEWLRICAADKARKMSAYGSLWLFISLLIGAFVASLTAVYGGRQRDL